MRHYELKVFIHLRDVIYMSEWKICTIWQFKELLRGWRRSNVIFKVNFSLKSDFQARLVNWPCSKVPFKQVKKLALLERKISNLLESHFWMNKLTLENHIKPSSHHLFFHNLIVIYYLYTCMTDIVLFFIHQCKSWVTFVVALRINHATYQNPIYLD